MKTKQQNKHEKKNSSAPEFQSRSEQLSGNSNSQTTATANGPENNQTTATATAPETGKTINNQQPANNPRNLRPYVNFEERERNRQLPLEKVLDTLRRFMPRPYELAEVVGKWIWVTFPEPPPETVRAELSQLGFHWNNVRKCWQHPCGQFTTTGTSQDPREKYGSHFPADLKAA